MNLKLKLRFKMLFISLLGAIYNFKNPEQAREILEAL